MSRNVSVFLPTRKGSERVKNKNTRTFSGVQGGLLAIKLEQLLSLQGIEEVVLSTNDPASIRVAGQFDDSRLQVVERPEHLAQSNTDLADLITYVPTVCKREHILWTHVTSPFTGTTHYEKAIEQYFEVIREEQHDSLMSGKWFQNFLWAPEKQAVINKNRGLKWPRTQDLAKWFEVDSAIFIADRKVYAVEADRIGTNPYLFAQEALASFDVDWEEDFKLAEALYANYK